MQNNISNDNKIHYEFIALIDKAGVELCRWLEENLLRFVGMNWWKRNVLKILNTEEQQKIKSQGSEKLQDFDIHLLLKVLERNYRFLKGKLRLPTDDANLIYEVRQIRNRCVGHRPIRGNDLEQLVRDIRTLDNFCTNILKSKKLSQELNDLIDRALDVSQPDATTEIAVAPTSVRAAKSSAVQPFIPEHCGFFLAKMYEGYELTPSQKDAVAGLESFLNDDKQNCFVLKGYAGTGKTFLIGGIVKYLNACHKSTVLMAPTGRAAHVMKERHKIPACTIHRHIYSLNRLKEFKEINEDGTTTYKFYFELKNNDNQHDSVFIVDEASMLSDFHTEAEFMRFGSGRLLRDLLEYINFDGNDYRKKIIFVGDNAQLPPVDMNFSPALDTAYLTKYTRSKVSSIELTDVLRQNEGGLILQNATKLRSMLASGNFASFDLKSDGESVTETKALIPNYLQHINQYGAAATVIIGCSNALAKDYNTTVRKYLFPNGRLLEPQDRVMLVKNTYRYEIELFNGQAGTVIEVSDDVETRSAYVNVGLDETGKRKNTLIELHFKKAIIRFESLDGTAHDISCLYIEDLLNSQHRELNSEQSKALYVDFRARHPDLSPSHPGFKDALISDSYFNALQLKYAYAITCHKAQGGEWETVYIDFQQQNKLNAMSIRWSYTALTRASRNVVATNALHHDILTPLKGNPVVTHSLQKLTPVTHNNTITAGSIPDFIADAPLIDQQIYSHLADVLPEGFEIESLKPRPYQSQWSIIQEFNSCLVNICYNGKCKISSVSLAKVNHGDDWAVPLEQAVRKLKGIQLITAPLATPIPDTVATSTYNHSDFIESLKIKAESLGLHLQTIEDLTIYHTRCTFEWGGDLFTVNYYFNKKQQFTYPMPEDGLTDSMLQMIATLHAGQVSLP